VVMPKFKAETQTRYFSCVSYANLYDSDYDGINDKDDANPTSNLQEVYYSHFDSPYGETSYSTKYRFNYQWFFDESSDFNKELAITSSLFEGLAYDVSTNERDGNPEDYYTFTNMKYMDFDSQYDPEFVEYISNIDSLEINRIDDVLENHGFDNVITYNLRDYSQDNHNIQFYLGHQLIDERINIGGDQIKISEKELVPLIIRGIYGREEWYSNFDIGNTDDIDYYSDWTEADHHKGFDIAANRVVDIFIEDYANNYSLDDENSIIWITGHSRGAAVSNLVAKKLIDKGYTVFSYTFATPNTTTDKSSSSNDYSSIFNILNQDDFVRYVPMAKWDFVRYGIDFDIDVTKTMEKELRNILADGHYNQDAQDT